MPWAEVRNSAQALPGRGEPRHPGRQDHYTPQHAETVSMAGTSKAIRLSKLVASSKLLALYAIVCSVIPKLVEVKN